MAATDEFIPHTATDEIVRSRSKIEKDPAGATPQEVIHGLAAPETVSEPSEIGVEPEPEGALA